MLVSFATGFYSLLLSASPQGGGGGGASPDQEGDVTIIDGVAHVSLGISIARAMEVIGGTRAMYGRMFCTRPRVVVAFGHQGHGTA